jgi:hypothetical protein
MGINNDPKVKADTIRLEFKELLIKLSDTPLTHAEVDSSFCAKTCIDIIKNNMWLKSGDYRDGYQYEWPHYESYWEEVRKHL